MADTPKIGWIGLGKMGDPMSRNLLKAGYAVTVHNRTRQKCDALAAEGAAVADSLAALGAAAEVVISMISDDPVLEAVSIGPEGCFTGMAPGSVFIEMSTVSPALSARVAEAAAAKSIRYLRAPVSGSVALATAGTLTIVVSGPRDTYDECLPIFEVLGAKCHHVGEAEEARVLKLCLNMMVGLTAAMVGEALAFGEGGGMEWQQMLDIFGDSVIASPLVGYKMQTLKNRDFSPAFTVAQMAKDFDLALEAASGSNAPLPLTTMVRQYWADMMAGGKGELDFFAYVTQLQDIARQNAAPQD